MANEDLLLRIGGEARGLVEAIGQASRVLGGLTQELRQVGRESDDAGRQARGLEVFLSRAGAALTGFLGAQVIMRGVSAGFDAAKSAAITLNAELETSTLQFETLMGDADKAQAHVRSLFEFAAKTPFETGPIIQASRMLETFGGAALNTQENLTLVGDAAAAVGAPIDEVGRWVGRLYANLDGGRPIGEAAQRLGELAVLSPKARAALEDVAASGASTADKFAAFQRELGRFSGAMEKQANTWKGVTSTFKENAQLAIATALRPLFEAARDAIGELNRLAETVDLEGWAVQSAGAVEVVADKLRAIPRVLVTIGLGIRQLKVEMLELQREFADLVLDITRKLGEAWRMWSLVPGIGQQIYGTLGGLMGAQEVKVRAQVDALATKIRDAEAELAKATVSAAAYTFQSQQAGEASARAARPVQTLGDTLDTTADKAERAAGKLAAYSGVVHRLPGLGSLSFGGTSLGNVTPTLAGGVFDVAGSLGRAANPQNPFGALFGTGLIGLRPPAVLGGGGVNPWGGSSQITNLLAAPGTNYSHLMAGLNWNGFAASGLNSAMPFLSQLVAGGSRGGQIGGSIGGSIGGGLSSLFAGASGVMGTIAPFLGPALGLVGGFLGKLFGPSRGAVLGKEADARMDQTRAQLLQQFGSLEAIAATGQAGAELVAGWGHKNVAGERAFNDLVVAFERQNALLDEQQTKQAALVDLEAQRKALAESLLPTWDQLAAAAGRYKFNATELGTEVAQIGATHNWKQILEDLDLFGRSTKDVGGYLSRMGGAISSLVNESLRLGTEIPENMRPFIENLAATGQLIDENGEAITDLSELKWGSAVQTEAEKTREQMSALDETIELLKQAIQELADALKTGLPQAARDGARDTEDALNNIRPNPIRIPYEYEATGETPDGVPGFSGGTPGLVDFGRQRLVALHGREAVLTEDTYRGVLESLRTADAVSRAVTANLQAVQETAFAVAGPGRVVSMAERVASGVTDALTALGGGPAAPEVNLHIETYDVGGITSAIERKLLPALLEALGANRGGSLTRLQHLLAAR